MSGCPSPQELERFIGGPRDAPEVAVFASHMETCPSCRKRVAELTGRREAHPAADTRLNEGTQVGAATFLRRLAEENTRIPEDTSERGIGESFGRYQLIRQIGAGGMGSVWLARDKELDREVALKVPRLDPFDTEGRERFRQEGRAAARLGHPNIATVYEVGEVGNTPYLTMEYIPGPTLAAHLASGRLSVTEAVRLGIAIARGLQHAHTVGVVHRDLKPANILLHGSVGPNNSVAFEPKITDFGLARRIDDPTGLTRTGTVMGTPAYMSPEQGAGRWDEVGPASDQFSLGVVLYEMLTGQRAPLVSRKPAPSQTAPGSGPMPDEIVLRALAPNPADRFPTVADMADQLEAWLRSPPAPTRRLRRRIAVIGFAFVAVFIGIALAVGWRPGHQPRPPEPVISNSLGMELVRIEPGEFVMGSREGEPGRSENEGPIHEVEITRPFYLARTEVTVGQFRRFVEATGYKATSDYPQNGGAGYDAETKEFHWAETFNWRNPGFAQTDDHPVVLVSWVDAQAFCDWLSKVEGRRYRLPTEAEWEYACRAGTSTLYWWGDDENGLQGRANLADRSLIDKLKEVDGWAMNWDDHYPFTAPVGSFARSPWGLHDMSGNVVEWCEDWYGPYSADRQRDPTGPATGQERVLRGGYWNGGSDVSRSADRVWSKPTDCVCYFGFRVAADPKD